MQSKRSAGLWERGAKVIIIRKSFGKKNPTKSLLSIFLALCIRVLHKKDCAISWVFLSLEFFLFVEDLKSNGWPKALLHFMVWEELMTSHPFLVVGPVQVHHEGRSHPTLSRLHKIFKEHR